MVTETEKGYQKPAVQQKTTDDVDGSVVKETDFHRANLGSAATGTTHMSHWWWQEGIWPKLLPCANKSAHLGRHVQALEHGSQLP